MVEDFFLGFGCGELVGAVFERLSVGPSDVEGGEVKRAGWSAMLRPRGLTVRYGRHVTL